MGAINYFTSDYITLAIKPYDSFDLEKDEDLMEEIKLTAEETGSTIKEALYNYIEDLYKFDFENIETELKKYCFDYYHITIKPGYYEGFSIDIDPDYVLYFDNYEEKQEAQRETTQLKHFLIACANLGMVTCVPGWCSSYSDYNGTLKEIRTAVQEMRDDIKQVPTLRQYEAC